MSQSCLFRHDRTGIDASMMHAAGGSRTNRSQPPVLLIARVDVGRNRYGRRHVSSQGAPRPRLGEVEATAIINGVRRAEPFMTVTPEVTFDQAVTEALAIGEEELAKLESLADQAVAAYHRSGHSFGDSGDDELLREFQIMESRFTEQVRGHLSAQRKVLSSFNIAFFGRTGAGKSTLLSAFGELDGSRVSPGPSDWTKTVQSVNWRGCRLNDTPGINGWGRGATRDELEAIARAAVETADVVLLCFDSQSQQDSEFVKVADWVRHYGKPTVAVLNDRNPLWRHPARVPAAARRNVSQHVRQHADNIRTELANIGLHDTPIVAVHSKRALFARASTPFRGPAQRDFTTERETYDIPYLARWSNFGVLETLLSGGIAAGGAQLRLTSLREGMRSLLLDEAEALEALGQRVDEKIDELDRVISRHLEVLGYLESDERAPVLHDDQWCGDLLTLVESAQGRPYRAPSDGTFSRYVNTLLKPHLSEPRNNAIRRCKQLGDKAFATHQSISTEQFADAVFDETEVQDALDAVVSDAARFLERELALAGAEFKPAAVDTECAGATVDGSAGQTKANIENVLKGAGLAVGSTSAAALIVIAFTNWWNPAGWAAGLALAGAGIAGQVFQWVGGNVGADAEMQRARAHAKAVKEGRSAVHETFDRIGKSFAQDARSGGWRVAEPVLRQLMRSLIALAALRSRVKELVAQLQKTAAEITRTPAVDVLDGAKRMLLEPGVDGDRAALERILLGEDWFDDESPAVVQKLSSADDLATCQARHRRDAAHLEQALGEAFHLPDSTRIERWRQRVAAAAEADEAFETVVAASTPPADARPTVAILGDFSAGKSSFVKRLLVEMGGDVPESLKIRADPTTGQAHRFHLTNFDVIDTPGFQSGRDGHDERATSAARRAAVVIVLLHVNLLIGDTTQLEAIANGTPRAVGTMPRLLFLVNRCDELGVDPVYDVAEYFNRRDRKEAELAAALRSREIEVDSSHLHGLASDPFGAVGSRWPVTDADYRDHREWDGVAALVEALHFLTREQIGQANVCVALDDACNELLALRADAQLAAEAHRSETGKYNSLIRALTICLDDAAYLTRSLEVTLSQIVGRHTTAALEGIRGLVRGDHKGLGEQIVSWAGAGAQEDVKRFMASASEEIEEWIATHSSAINREFAAAQFAGDLGLTDSDTPSSNDGAEGAVKAAGTVTQSAQKLVAALGSRDAVYGLGKAFKYKFKPWEAVKTGAKVAKAGAVLQAVAVVWDAVSWAQLELSRRSWESVLADAEAQVEAASSEKVHELLHGDGGPLVFLAARQQEISEIREHYRERQAATQDDVDMLAIRNSVIDDLLADATDMRKVQLNG